MTRAEDWLERLACRIFADAYNGAMIAKTHSPQEYAEIAAKALESIVHERDELRWRLDGLEK